MKREKGIIKKEDVVIDLPRHNISKIDTYLDNHIEKHLNIRNRDIASVHPSKTHLIVYTDRKGVCNEYIVTYKEIREYIKSLKTK